MTNHVHLLMTAPSIDRNSQVMQNLGRYYVRYVNRTYQRTGTLWEGRFKSTLVDTESYLLTLYRYIELNPVRARMVGHPAAYPWSSYQGNAGDRNITLLTPHPLYLALGNTKSERKSAYQSLFLSHQSDNTIQAIRDATNKAWALGDDSFIEQVLIPYLEELSHYHKAVIEGPRRLMLQKSHEFYFSTNLTPQVCRNSSKIKMGDVFVN
jgi:putative transposase